MRGQIENLSATSLSFTQCLAGDRLNKGPDQNLICPLKSRFHLITLCRRNYPSGLASLAHLALSTLTSDLIFGEHWRGEQCLKLLLDTYFGCRRSLFH